MSVDVDVIAVSGGTMQSGVVASLVESLTPMLIADDQRHYVGVNTAMCLLLRLDRAAVLRMRVDDLTPPELRADMEQSWGAFMREGVLTGLLEC